MASWTKGQENVITKIWKCLCDLRKLVESGGGGGGTLQSVTDAGNTTTNSMDIGEVLTLTDGLSAKGVIESGANGMYIQSRNQMGNELRYLDISGTDIRIHGSAVGSTPATFTWNGSNIFHEAFHMIDGNWSSYIENTPVGDADSLIIAVAKLQGQVSAIRDNSIPGLRGTFNTVDATPTATLQWDTVDGFTYGAQIKVIAKLADGKAAMFNSAALLSNHLSNLNVINTQTNIYSPIRSTGLESTAVLITDTDNKVTVQITGVAATSIDWEIQLTILTV